MEVTSNYFAITNHLLKTGFVYSGYGLGHGLGYGGYGAYGNGYGHGFNGGITRESHCR